MGHLGIAILYGQKFGINRLSRVPVILLTDIYTHIHVHTLGWRFSVAVTRWSRSTQLLYIEPG